MLSDRESLIGDIREKPTSKRYSFNKCFLNDLLLPFLVKILITTLWQLAFVFFSRPRKKRSSE